MRIGLIGNGNLAWHLSRAMRNAGLHIYAHLSRHNDQSQGWELHRTWDTMPADLDVYFLAVPDSAIAAVCAHIRNHSTVIHFSGGSDIEAISQPHRAVCWPCQTLTRGTEIDYAKIPVLYECADEATEQIIEQTLKKAWGTWTKADGKQRLAAHAAAVFSNNFTNHLQHIAHQLLHEAGLPGDLLHPMVKAHMKLLDNHEPSEVQTGPAKRNDIITLQRHLHVLQHHPDWKKLYEALSEDIINTYHNKGEGRRTRDEG
jgi:predicted short-subunit dehydrogenase-like oxidoreductase (DUF2520 family)